MPEPTCGGSASGRHSEARSGAPNLTPSGPAITFLSQSNPSMEKHGETQPMGLWHLALLTYHPCANMSTPVFCEPNCWRHWRSRSAPWSLVSSLMAVVNGSLLIGEFIADLRAWEVSCRHFGLRCHDAHLHNAVAIKDPRRHQKDAHSGLSDYRDSGSASAFLFYL